MLKPSNHLTKNGLFLSSRFLKSLGTAGGLLLVSSCGNLNQANNQRLVTLGDIYSQSPVVKTVKQRRISAQQAIESYEEVIQTTEDENIQAESSQRIANLSLIASDERVYFQGELADRIDELKAQNEILSQENNEDPLVQESIKNQIQRNLDEIASAQTEIRELDVKNKRFFEEAVVFYENIVSDKIERQGNDKILYHLAAAYDSQGQTQDKISALNRLIETFPESSFYIEAQFRSGEALFSEGDYEAAASAYRSVIDSEGDGRFREHSLYKHGWSLYKLSEYEAAIDHFISLRDTLEEKIFALQAEVEAEEEAQEGAQEGAQKGAQEKVKPNTSLNRLVQETNRVIALSFSHLNAGPALKDYFAKIGSRNYELEIYTQLHENLENQERFRDAGKTYDVFLETYPDHKFAPQLQTEILQAYTDGGFPSLVIPGKIAFVQRFGINSSYWERFVDENSPENQYTQEEKQALITQVKTHLADLSKFYHATAQETQKKSDYQTAANWYREYLDTFGNQADANTPETLEIRNLLAESLYESGQNIEAAQEFEKLAQVSEASPQARADASYFALLAYERNLENYQGEAENKKPFIEQKIASGRLFIQEFSNDPRMPNVLGNIVREQIAIEDFEGAVENSRVLVNLDPAASEDLQRTAWVTIANAEFDSQDYLSASQSYTKVLSFDGFTPEQRANYEAQVATSAYKNAESIKDEGDLIASAEEFVQVAEQSKSDSEVRPKAYFDAATIYLEAEEWEKSLEILNKFEQFYPNHELAETLPDKRAIAYKNTNQYGKAAENYEILSERYTATDSELARQTLLEAASLMEKSQNGKKTRDLYKKYASNFKAPLEDNVEVQYKLVQLYNDVDDDYRSEFWKRQIISSHSSAGDENTPRITYLAAQMKFENSENDYSSFNEIKLTQPLQKSLKKKKDQMEITLKNYQDVSETGSAEWATAANHRIALIYKKLAEDLLNSEQPTGLTEGQLEQYSYLIEDQAIPFEDKAIEFFALNTQLVQQNVYGQWVKDSFAELAKLIPGRYAKFEKRDDYVESIY